MKKDVGNANKERRNASPAERPPKNAASMRAILYGQLIVGLILIFAGVRYVLVAARHSTTAVDIGVMLLLIILLTILMSLRSLNEQMNALGDLVNEALSLAEEIKKEQSHDE